MEAGLPRLGAATADRGPKMILKHELLQRQIWGTPQGDGVQDTPREAGLQARKRLLDPHLVGREAALRPGFEPLRVLPDPGFGLGDEAPDASR